MGRRGQLAAASVARHELFEKQARLRLSQSRQAFYALTLQNDAEGALLAAELTGSKVEWHFSGHLEAEAIRALLQEKKLEIIDVWSPRVGG